MQLIVIKLAQVQQLLVSHESLLVAHGKLDSRVFKLDQSKSRVKEGRRTGTENNTLSVTAPSAPPLPIGRVGAKELLEVEQGAREKGDTLLFTIEEVKVCLNKASVWAEFYQSTIFEMYHLDQAQLPSLCQVAPPSSNLKAYIGCHRKAEKVPLQGRAGTLI